MVEALGGIDQSRAKGQMGLGFEKGEIGKFAIEDTFLAGLKLFVLATGRAGQTR